MLATVGTLVATAVPGGATTPTFTVPSSIDKTGKTDVTNALQTFLSSQTANNAVIVFPAGAKYRVDGTLHLIGRHDIWIIGTGATVFAGSQGDRTRSQFLIRTSNNIVFTGITVKGANPHAGTGDDAYVSTLEAQNGFEIEGSTNVELDKVTVTDTYGDFVYIGRDPKTRVWSDGVTVQNSTFDRNGRMGISIIAGRHVNIVNNTINDTRRSVIDMEPASSSMGAQYVTIAYNKIGTGRLNFVSVGKAVGTGSNDVHDVMIAFNTLRGHSLSVFVATREATGQRRSNFSVIANNSDVTLAKNSTPPMRFTDVDGVTVQQNVEPIATSPPVATTDCTKVAVSNNTFS